MIPKSTIERIRGLRALIEDAVEHGSSAVERVHLETAHRPFAVLDLVPGLQIPARGARVVHDQIVSGTYETVRLVNRVVGRSLEAVIDAAEQLGDTAARAGGGTADAEAPPPA
jgi:hypothetical protein